MCSKIVLLKVVVSIDYTNKREQVTRLTYFLNNKPIRGGKVMGKVGKSVVKNAWQNLMKSTQDKLSRGSASINKIITWARSSNWRRKQNDRTPKSRKK